MKKFKKPPEVPQVIHIVEESHHHKSSITYLSVFSTSLPSLVHSILSINHNFSVKIDDLNYLIWEEQSKNIVIFYGIESFINGLTLPQSEFIKCIVKTNDEQSIINTYEYLEENSEYDFGINKIVLSKTVYIPQCLPLL